MTIEEYYTLVREMNKINCYKEIMDIAYKYYTHHSPNLLELAVAFNKIYFGVTSVDGADKVMADINNVFIEHEAKLRDTIIPILTRVKDKLNNSEFIENFIVYILDDLDEFDDDQMRRWVNVLDKIHVSYAINRINFTEEDTKQVISIYESILTNLGKIAKLRFDAACLEVS